MKKLVFVFGLLVALASGILFSQTSVRSVHADPAPHLNEVICHYDGKSGKYSQVTIDIDSIKDCTDAHGHGDHDNDIIPSYTYPGCTYAGKNLDKVSWIANNCSQPVVDQCTNIDGVQATVPDGDYQSNGQCFPKTPVCTDPSATNYDSNFNSTTEVSDKTTCNYPVDQCINIPGLQDEVPTGMQTNSDHVCSCKAGFHEVDDIDDETFSCRPDPTPTVPTPSVTPSITPTPTTTSGGSNGGDGKSDGLGCGSHDCSQHQSSGGSVLGASTGPEQAVLGASTMAGTGTFAENIMNLMFVAGTIILGAGIKSYAKEKKN